MSMSKLKIRRLLIWGQKRMNSFLTSCRQSFGNDEPVKEKVMATKKLLVATALLGLAAAGHASEQEGWQFELTPYFWGANVDGDLKLGNLKGNIDNDTWENLDSGFMGMGIISYNRVVFYLDYDYLSLSDDAKAKGNAVLPAGTKITSDNDLEFATGGVGWRFDTWGEKNTLDVLVGVRHAKLDLELKGGGQKYDNTSEVTDPLIMLRPSLQISDNWRFNPTLSLGVGGDSDSHYELMPQFQYNFSDYFALRFGYKRIYYDVNDGKKYTSSYREFDGSFSGPFVGLGWTFPEHNKPKPAEAPLPPPPPPPPAKCPDSDRDGVCDAADLCPTTPPGKRVDAHGCDCDFTMATHFAFDSAKLTDEDMDQLDKLAKLIVNPKLNYIVGEIDGYTDSVGKPAYNQKLSERRAHAVADYLQSKGITTTGSNLRVQGFGESDPVADNKTEDGRAQNRRVIIRRTDCSR
jgi:outer membrane protein OmpA-like peptidoglycan-associated protein